MNKIKQMLVALALVVGATALFAPVAVGAVSVFGDCAVNDTRAVCSGRGDEVEPLLKTVTNTLLFVVGAVSVIVIIVGGLMYALSAGDAGAVTKAKNTILYAVVGLVVAFLAYAIVNWVLSRF